MMEWSPQQHDALESVRRWLDSDDDRKPQVFSLFGYAGSGKTTLAIEIAKMVDGDVLFATFTGKAALVMRRKGCEGAQTIHSLIYKVRTGKDGTIKVQLDKDSELKDADLLIIDECSMVGEEVGEDLLSFDVPILVLGDPAQLPPVEGGGFFTEVLEPHVMLTEIHRQAEGNPIIRLATQVRLGERPSLGSFKGDGAVAALSVIDRRRASDSSLLAADQIIVGTNNFRQSLNARIRRQLHDAGKITLGPVEHMPVLNDRLICLRNKRDRGLYNGGMWTLRAIKDRSPGAKKRGATDVSYLRLDSLDVEAETDVAVEVPHAFWEGTDKDLPVYVKRAHDEFDYAYAITCHKSQGSQWDKVFVYDDGFIFKRSSDDMPRRWLYTAITRAADKLIVAL